jgi:hypothetical protein
MFIKDLIKEDLAQKICECNDENHLQSESCVLRAQSFVHHNLKLPRVQNQNCNYVQNVAGKMDYNHPRIHNKGLFLF